MNGTLVDAGSLPTARGLRRRRIRRALVIVLVAMAAAAWTALVNRSTLWADELFSLALATGHSLEHPAAMADERLGDWVESPTAMAAERYRHYLEHEEPPASPKRIVRAVKLSDTSPPLYYLAVYFWTRAFGTSDFALRLFSVACALGAFPGVVYLARRSGGSAAVIPAAILFAASPAVIAYAVEGRMYALVWLLGSGLGALTLTAARRQSGPGTLGVWAVTAAAGLLTHYFFVFPWAACVAWLAFQRGRWRAPVFWAAVLLTVALVAPWYMTIGDIQGQWRVTAGWLAGGLGKRQLIVGPLKLAWGLLSGHGDWDAAGRPRWLVTAVLLVLAVAVLRRGWRRILNSTAFLLWLWLLAVCLGLVVLDLALGTHATLIARYALVALPPALALTATGLAQLRQPWRAVLLLLFIVAAAPADRAMYMTTARRGHAFREIAADVRGAGSSRDVVALVHSIPSGVLGVARYADPDTRVASWVGQLDQRRVPESIMALTRDSTIVVFVKIHPVGAPAPEEDWLRDHAETVSEVRRQAAYLATFRPPPASAPGSQ